MRPDDLDALHVAASDPLIWAQHSERNRHERAVFERFFEGALASGGALTVVERASTRADRSGQAGEAGTIIGSSRYYDWNAADRSIVIGYTFLVRAHWGIGTNRELKALMLAHAFTFARTVWFHVSKDNARSRRALEKLGATLDHEASVPVGGVPAWRCIYRIDRDAAAGAALRA